MRLLSLTASSAASWITVSPSANAAAIASTGSSSMIDSSPAMSVPCSGAAVMWMSPTGSPISSPVTVDVDRRAHLAQDVDVRDAGRVQAHALERRGREPGTMHAATTKNAADDGSPGTSISNGRGSPARDPHGPVVGPVQRRRPSAPSIRSVWSRLGAGSTISVVAVGLEPGEHQRGLHLTARGRELVAHAAAGRRRGR